MGICIVIYQIFNQTQSTLNYFCPDQATIDAGKALGHKGNFVIGGQSDAEQIQAENVLYVQSLLSVNKDIDPDPVQTTWIPCDLETELENNDIDYYVFNVIDGYYTSVTGLDNAKTLFESVKTAVSEHFLPVLTSYEEWKPSPTQPLSQGTQTL